MFLASLLLLAASVPVHALGPPPNSFRNLVTFGDSYTDVGTPGDNGTAWPVYASLYGNFSLFPFAKSGAVCSLNLTNRPFPSLLESQIPSFASELEAGSLSAVQGDVEGSLFTLWIGTNDVGRAALLTGDQEPGVTLPDLVECAVSWISTMYLYGARNFLFQNMLPLQKTVLYSNITYPNIYWTFDHNATEWSLMMTEYTASANKIQKLMLKDIAASLTDAHIGFFDSHGLINDIITNPSNYLNGTAPLNVTGPIKSCVLSPNESVSGSADCTIVNGTDRDSYLWYDELHPSEQTDRVIARSLVDAVQRTSENWVTWLS